LPFNGNFLYVLAAPAFLGGHLGLAPTQFFWFFVLNIGGIMAGAWVSGRMAGRVSPRQQIRHGFTIMAVAAALNLVANALFTAHVLGHAPADGVCLRLGLDGAGHHALGTGFASRAPWHGLVVADVRRLGCQRDYGRGDRAVGHAFHKGHGDGDGRTHGHGFAGMVRVAPPLAGHRAAGRRCVGIASAGVGRALTGSTRLPAGESHGRAQDSSCRGA